MSIASIIFVLIILLFGFGSSQQKVRLPDHG